MNEYNFGGSVCNLTRLYQATSREAGVIMIMRDNVGTNFEMGASNKIWEAKNVQNSARFLQLSSSSANNSGLDLQNANLKRK